MYARQKHYQAVSLASRIEAASSHQLVSILYEELIRSLDVCCTAISQRKPDALRSAHTRAVSILLSLQGSLDVERGGALAASLSGIYQSMNAQLFKAVRSADMTKMVPLRQGVADLLEAWTSISLSHAA